MKYNIQTNEIIGHNSTERENKTMVREASLTALYMAELLSSGAYSKGHV